MPFVLAREGAHVPGRESIVTLLQTIDANNAAARARTVEDLARRRWICCACETRRAHVAIAV